MLWRDAGSSLASPTHSAHQDNSDDSDSVTLDGSDRPTTLDAYGLDQYQERITMRRSHVGVATVCGVVLLGAASPAHAEDPTLNEKNCAGVATSGFAGPGFGATVGFFAQAQLVDNFGLAACGDAPRGNT